MALILLLVTAENFLANRFYREGAARLEKRGVFHEEGGRLGERARLGVAVLPTDSILVGHLSEGARGP